MCFFGGERLEGRCTSYVVDIERMTKKPNPGLPWGRQQGRASEGVGRGIEAIFFYFSCVTYCINLIHIAMTSPQDIP